MVDIKDNETLPSQRAIGISVTSQPTNQRTVYVTIKDCPPGFELFPIENKCDCNRAIQELKANVSCHSSTATLLHKGGVWIGYDSSQNCVLTSTKCQPTYCRSEGANFTIDNQDLQCNYDRSGLLCGQCAEGLSLMLGSDQCGECGNLNILLVIPFFLAGFLLIGLIIFLNLTVSTGLVNGLIFYANIVKINEASFFPDGPVTLLSQFISWINLDFGIKSCFYNGLTGYMKIWLQFVFPLYLWMFIILIIIGARYSTKVAKLMGRQAVPVLATVILLSFTKLFRTCIMVWQSVFIDYCDGNEVQRWAFDANVPYNSGKHLALFIFAIILFWAFLVPYTILIVMGPLIERYLSKFKVFKWWFKLKPLFDAYSGPYRDRYRFWTGLLLLARIVLVQVFAFTRNSTVANIFVIAVVSILLGFLGTIYRHKVLDVLEMWFLLNIIFGSLSTIGRAAHISLISTALTFLTFISIVIYQVLLRFNLIDRLKPKLVMLHAKCLRSKFPVDSTSQSKKAVICSIDKSPSITSSEIEGLPRARYLEDSVCVERKRETLIQEDSLSYVDHQQLSSIV